MGASRFPSDAHDGDDLFRHADAADVLKLDGTFLPGPEDDDRARRLLEASLDLVDALGMTAVVEGVETPAHRELIVGRGSTCHAQGFHLARPMPPEGIPAVMRGE